VEIINFLKEFAENNGASSVIVLIGTVIITNLIKIPIKKHAEKIAALAQKSGFDVSKGFITSKVVYIPFAVALGLFCITDAISIAFGGTFNFVAIVAKTPIIAAASIGLYSVVTNAILHEAEKSEYNEYVKSKITEYQPAETAEAKPETATTTVETAPEVPKTETLKPPEDFS
jgi:hypothetical protein